MAYINVTSPLAILSLIFTQFAAQVAFAETDNDLRLIPNEDFRGAVFTDGTILVHESGLIARPVDAPQEMTYDQAVSYCDELEANGRDDWQLPTADQFRMAVWPLGMKRSSDYYWTTSDVDGYGKEQVIPKWAGPSWGPFASDPAKGEMGKVRCFRSVDDISPVRLKF